MTIIDDSAKLEHIIYIIRQYEQAKESASAIAMLGMMRWDMSPEDYEKEEQESEDRQANLELSATKFLTRIKGILTDID